MPRGRLDMDAGGSAGGGASDQDVEPPGGFRRNLNKLSATAENVAWFMVMLIAIGSTLLLVGTFRKHGLFQKAPPQVVPPKVTDQELQRRMSEVHRGWRDLHRRREEEDGQWKGDQRSVQDRLDRAEEAYAKVNERAAAFLGTVGQTNADGSITRGSVEGLRARQKELASAHEDASRRARGLQADLSATAQDRDLQGLVWKEQDDNREKAAAEAKTLAEHRKELEEHIAKSQAVVDQWAEVEPRYDGLMPEEEAQEIVKRRREGLLKDVPIELDPEEVRRSVRPTIAKWADELLSSETEAAAQAAGQQVAHCSSMGELKRLVREAHGRLAADGTGMRDLAAGGKIIHGAEHTSPTWTPSGQGWRAKVDAFTPLSTPRKVVQGPEAILDADTSVGKCWAFPGSQGKVSVTLPTPAILHAVSLEHVYAGLVPDHGSAPRQFRVYGYPAGQKQDSPDLLLESAQYNITGSPTIQTFALSDHHSEHRYQAVMLEVLNNHGSNEYTCLYRFRVHGSPVPAGHQQTSRTM